MPLTKGQETGSLRSLQPSFALKMVALIGRNLCVLTREINVTEREECFMPSAVVDLFCGVGGLTHGLQLSGLNVVAGIDIEESCRYAYEHNNNARFINADITHLTGEELEALYPVAATKILVGCAPCQPFSKYTQRYRKDGQTDAKWRLLYSFSRLVGEVTPSVIAMENVPELHKEKVFQDFVQSLVRQGYHVDWQIVYCPDYSVPQHRKRLVLLASILGEIHLIPPILDPEHYITVRDAIGNLPVLGDGEVDPNDVIHQASRLSDLNRRRIRQSVPGGTWRDWDVELQLSCHQKNTGRTYPAVYGRMSWDAPSPTITTQFYGIGNGRFGHPEQNRALTIREGAMLQSFPADYQFVAPGDKVVKRSLGIHIGNAVPVNLGRAIGESIIDHMEEAGAND